MKTGHQVSQHGAYHYAMGQIGLATHFTDVSYLKKISRDL